MSIVADVARGLIGPVTGLISEFIEDKDKANELAHRVATMAAENQQAIVMAQLEINKAEAVHRNIWVAGWRPGFGWICALAFFLNFIFFPLVMFFSAYLDKPLVTPQLDMAVLMPVVLGMLGLGGMRSFEKFKGVAK